MACLLAVSALVRAFVKASEGVQWPFSSIETAAEYLVRASSGTMPSRVEWRLLAYKTFISLAYRMTAPRKLSSEW